MSAYIVSKAHIDAVVTFAVGGQRRVGTVKRITEDAGQAKYVSSSDYTPSQIGAALWAENHASVDYRYKDSTPVPAYVFRPNCHGGTCTKPTRQLTPLDVIKLCQSLKYQSCEHPGWKASFANEFLNRVISAAIGALPGYDNAFWGIDN
jgi:hypothetical protein